MSFPPHARPDRRCGDRIGRIPARPEVLQPHGPSEAREQKTRASRPERWCLGVWMVLCCKAARARRRWSRLADRCPSVAPEVAPASRGTQKRLQVSLGGDSAPGESPGPEHPPRPWWPSVWGGRARATEQCRGRALWVSICEGTEVDGASQAWSGFTWGASTSPPALRGLSERPCDLIVKLNGSLRKG